MHIGIVNMHKDLYRIHSIVKTLTMIGATSYTIDGTSVTGQELVHKIEHSPIHHWIFSGSQYHVTHEDRPQVPMELFNLDKQFMMICYSMESVLLQLGTPIRERYIHRKEPFNLTIPHTSLSHPLFKAIQNPMKSWRDHRWYFNQRDIHVPVKLLASYNGEAMIVTYKNAVLVQHHPEKTAAGRQFIKNWIQ
jgi:GMP synthase-like glutamine amidotransferase